MILIYHNPRWSKSRESVKILDQTKQEYKIINYMNSGINESEIYKILNLLSLDVLDIIRVNDKKYKELNLCAEDEKNKRVLIKKIIENPAILQRPIVLMDNKGIIGRPPEKILDLIRWSEN